MVAQGFILAEVERAHAVQRLAMLLCERRPGLLADRAQVVAEEVVSFVFNVAASTSEGIVRGGESIYRSLNGKDEEFVQLAECIIAQLDPAFLIKYNEIAMEDATARLMAVAADYNLPVNIARHALEAAAREAARENTGRTTATPRPETAAVAQVFAEAATKSSRRYTHHVFTEQELRDPEMLNRARDTLSDIQIARRTGAQISKEQRQAAKWADAFIRRARQQLNAA